MKNKKNTKGIAMPMIVVMILAVMVLVGVFYVIIKAETIRKIEELPEFEEEVEEEVAVPDYCPVEIGYLSQSKASGGKQNYLHYVTKIPIYSKETKEIIEEKEHTIVTPIYLSGNQFYVDVPWRVDINVGFVKEIMGNNLVTFYCDAKERAEGYVTSPFLFDEFGGSYSIFGISQMGKKILCKENRTVIYNFPPLPNNCFDRNLFYKLPEKIYYNGIDLLKRNNKDIIKAKENVCKVELVLKDDLLSKWEYASSRIVIRWDEFEQKTIVFLHDTSPRAQIYGLSFKNKEEFKTPDDIQNFFNFRNENIAKKVFEVLNAKNYSEFFEKINVSEFRDNIECLESKYGIKTKEECWSDFMNYKDKIEKSVEECRKGKYLCLINETKGYENCDILYDGMAFCSIENPDNCLIYNSGDVFIKKVVLYHGRNKIENAEIETEIKFGSHLPSRDKPIYVIK